MSIAREVQLFTSYRVIVLSLYEAAVEEKSFAIAETLSTIVPIGAPVTVSQNFVSLPLKDANIELSCENMT